MTLAHPWVLFLVLGPLAWAVWEWPRTQRRSSLILKAASFALILLALSEPVISTTEDKLGVVILADTSASMSEADLARMSGIANRIDKDRGRHWTRLIPFARTSRNPDPSEGEPGSWKLRRTAGEAGRATDLEAAVRDAASSLPPDLLPRIVLISDGLENSGAAARAVWQARQLGIPIDTYAVPGRAKPNLRLESLTLPSMAFAGEQFPVDLVVSSPKAASGNLEVYAEGKSLGSTPVSLNAGSTALRAHASVSVAGAISLAVLLSAGDLGEVRFEQAMTLRRPKLLLISQDPQDSEAHLMATLGAAQFEITRAADVAKEKLEGYQVVMLNNQDLEAIPDGVKNDIERYVKQGGGLIVLGGERNVYAENKKIEDALDRTLPAKLAPPRSPEGTAVVLIIDKSSSMEGKKIELARLAAIGVVEHLRPVDLVGVLIFDNSFQWAVPVRRAEDRTLIKRLISGITPDGGTQIAPALTEAYRKILPANATYKHIVLLTDGISEEGDSLELSREAVAKHVTISTVGLGQDVNRAYLEKVASFAAGKSYFLNDPVGLEQILLRDVLEHTGSTAIEKPLKAEILKKTEILDGVAMESAPVLKGYVKFIAKPDAETILGIDQKDPLYTRWQFGLGRAAVFASDAKNRWAADWINWKGFDRFWTNTLRDLLPHAQAGEATVDFDSANGTLRVDYRLARNVPEPKSIPAVYLFGPNQFQRPIEVKKVSEGVFRGTASIGQRQGLFRIRPVEESRAFPETGFYRQEAELNDYGSNEVLLRQIAALTGGRFNPTSRQVFDAGGRSIATTLRLWPGLLGLVVLLNLLELILRKGGGLLQSLGFHRVKAVLNT